MSYAFSTIRILFIGSLVCSLAAACQSESGKDTEASDAKDTVTAEDKVLIIDNLKQKSDSLLHTHDSSFEALDRRMEAMERELDSIEKSESQ